MEKFSPSSLTKHLSFKNGALTYAANFKLSFLILAMFVTLNSCSHSETDRGSYSKSEYLINPYEKTPPPGWEIIDSEGADFAIISDITGSLFIINSACKSNHNVNLENLTHSLLAGIDKINIKSTRIINYQNQESKVLELEGYLDSIKRYLKILTTIKGVCIYDFSLISTSSEHFQKDTIEFENFLQAMKIN